MAGKREVVVRSWFGVHLPFLNRNLNSIYTLGNPNTEFWIYRIARFSGLKNTPSKKNFETKQVFVVNKLQKS